MGRLMRTYTSLHTPHRHTHRSITTIHITTIHTLLHTHITHTHYYKYISTQDVAVVKKNVLIMLCTDTGTFSFIW